MSFAGLQDLLKKKKGGGSGGTGGTTATLAGTTTNTDHPAVVHNPYAAAAARVQARKEEAPPTTAAVAAEEKKPVKEEQRASASEGEADQIESRKRGRSPPAPPPLLSRTDLDGARAVMVEALMACMAVAPVRGEHRVPAAVRAFLRARYILRDPAAMGGAAAANGGEELAECAALRSALSELRCATASATPELEAGAGCQDARRRLVELIDATWYLTSAYWCAALLGSTQGGTPAPVTDTRQSPELVAEFGAVRGWSYPVYLLAAHALPDVLRLGCGREVATALEVWRTARRTVAAALELLAYLLEDLNHTGADEVCPDSRAGPGAVVEDADTAVVPPSVRDGLHSMLVRSVKQTMDFPAARQAYVDLTLGNANWKLGLFSAGEVHMRRSVEKLERNRIAHVLNNELAMRLLHATRELVQFAEQQWRSRGEDGQRARTQFFASTPTS